MAAVDSAAIVLAEDGATIGASSRPAIAKTDSRWGMNERNFTRS
jgi:hypothetical protein